MTRNNAPVDAEGLADELARARAAEDVRRADELTRVRAQAGHDRDRADVATEVRLAELDRAEREAAATAAARLARMYREAKEAGERTRITAGLARSGEARALRLERLRTMNLRVLVPVLLGFAAWSTTGVQAGAARLMGIGHAAPMWWVLWALEPVLIGAVVWVIIARARLASAGGVMDAAADRIAAGCLTVSIMLNLIAAIPEEGGHGWSTIGAMIAHAVGPVGAAATAHLIGLVDRSIGDADPWTDRATGERVPLLAEMDLRPPSTVPVRRDGAERPAAPRAPRRPVAWPVERGGRLLLPLAGRCDSSEIRRGHEADTEPSPSVDSTPADLRESEPWSDDRPVGIELWDRIAPGDPELWVSDQGRVTAEQVAAFLADHRTASNGNTPAPAAAAGPVNGSHHIDGDQPKTGPAGTDADRVASAAAARRHQGRVTRRRIVDHIAVNPDATPRQIAEAVGVSVTTVRRHLTALPKTTD